MNVQQILKNNNFIFKKKFGQNFLLDQNILNNIVSLADITKDTLVIEVGVGAGALTKLLSKKAKTVIGYEIDVSLKEPLNEILGEYSNVEIVFDDFLERNIISDIKKYDYKKLVFVANLPYYITTPIISKIIQEKIDVSKMVVMVQNEVALRFSASPGSKSYNSLTVFLNYYFNVKKAFPVSKNVFYPKPNVDSAVVVFEKKQKKIMVNNEEVFFRLIKDAFKFKRKTLKNNLKNYDYNLITKALEQCGKNLNCRAENLSLDDFIVIANSLSQTE